MAVWSGLGINYKSLTRVNQDIAYFNSIGINKIRPHIPNNRISKDRSSLEV